MDICISKLGHRDSNNGSSLVVKIQKSSFKKMNWKKSPAKWRSFCLDLNVLNYNNYLQRPRGLSLVASLHQIEIKRLQIYKPSDILLYLWWYFTLK